MSDSDDFFCKLLTISFPFQIKKENFKFYSKFRNICENVIFDQKPQNWQHCKIGSINLKMIVGFGISFPKLEKYEIFRLWHFLLSYLLTLFGSCLKLECICNQRISKRITCEVRGSKWRLKEIKVNEAKIRLNSITGEVDNENIISPNPNVAF